MGATDPRARGGARWRVRSLSRALGTSALLAAAVFPVGPARADGFPARSIVKPFFLADILAVPAVPGSLEVEVSWEIPVPELGFREEHGYFRARYDVSVVCRRDGKQIAGDIWNRRVRLQSFAETRDPGRFARGRARLRVPEGDFQARVEVRDRQTGGSSRIEGRVDGEAADVRIGLGDLRLLRYTEGVATPNREGEIPIGEGGHRVRVPVRTSKGVGGPLGIEWRIRAPDGTVAKADTTIEVRSGETVVELPLETADLSPGLHRLEVRVKDSDSDPRTAELRLRVTADWFVARREETLEILAIAVPGGTDGLREAEGEAEWRRALDEFWRERGGFRPELQERIELACTYFVEPFRSPGWKTDRGKVLLEHGEPPRRSVRPGTEELPPSEYWEYDEPRRHFLFVDVRGTGEYWLE